MNELIFLPAVLMAEQVRKKKISPVELVDAHLRQIERVNPKLNAFVQVDTERARQAAQEAEITVMREKKLGPLHGVPISIKSSLAVTGMLCESGTRLRAGFVPAQDAPLVARLRAAGAIVLGVTNTPELLMAWETDNLLYGRTNNPWDLDRTPGGSSGGEAAAIAAGMSAGGVGSDGGGSIRVPAHFSGICGLKPTPGRIPATGHYPVSAGPFALIGVVGPMARTVADLKVLFEVMQGPDAGDTCAAPVPLRWTSGRNANTESGLFRRRRPHAGHAGNPRGRADCGRRPAQHWISGGTLPAGRTRGSAPTLAHALCGCRRDAAAADVQGERIRPQPHAEAVSGVVRRRARAHR